MRKLNRAMTKVAALTLALAATQASAQQFPDPGGLVFPPQFIEQAGTFVPISGMASIINPSGRQYLGYVSSSVFAGQVSEPVFIVGMQLRLAIGNNWKSSPTATYGTSWPNVDFTMPLFEVTMGRPSPEILAAGGPHQPGGILSGSWDAYFDTNRTQVRSGLPLHVAANSYHATGGATGVHEWGPVIEFDTPYVYSPDEPLVYFVRHLGIEDTSELIPVHFASRYGGALLPLQALLSTNPFSPTPQSATNVHYVRFVTAPIPEPSMVGLLVPAGMLALRRRR